ncbi:uncharacterized protein LOC130173760 isoform X2 [Seriola aureovittata]|uniref:uncharacterized protein LOC130173760 isoform X2 n=1 Tax=Seriola aureovittata TaxID=2871759 RepID=UPI0024BE1CDB|nr:uncharacterized protein LOC130173760 isoform X2 [Seriola aureovittata]
MYGQRTALILLGTASVIQTTEVPHHISLTVVEPGDNLTLTYHKNQKMSVHVKQSPETASVQLGASMTLQCSLLYTNKESRAQCPGEHSVHWFRAGSGGFHPGIIYTHSNRSDEQEERSCVYSLSKTIQNSSDAGTYYCAVVTCGEILFGEGTKVETRWRHRGTELLYHWICPQKERKKRDIKRVHSSSDFCLISIKKRISALCHV